MTHDEILDLARGYAAARAVLAERIESAREEQRKIMRRRLRGLRAAVAETAAAREALAEAIEAHKGLFGRPRTRTVEGVKYGLRKQPGRIKVADEATAIARLRKRLGPQAEAHVRAREELVKDALRELDARTLAHCGIAVTDDSDAVTITVPKDDLDKVVEVMLDGMEEAE
ncbi:MAG: hypothetical protein F4Y03_00485 [Alphaproteobacteria bacterium]|nr:hypothetical protein [Alphaproteobacteria bacterium]